VGEKDEKEPENSNVLLDGQIRPSADVFPIRKHRRQVTHMHGWLYLRQGSPFKLEMRKIKMLQIA
jgi:hypothetical protein